MQAPAPPLRQVLLPGHRRHGPQREHEDEPQRSGSGKDQQGARHPGPCQQAGKRGAVGFFVDSYLPNISDTRHPGLLELCLRTAGRSIEPSAAGRRFRLVGLRTHYPSVLAGMERNRRFGTVSRGRRWGQRARGAGQKEHDGTEHQQRTPEALAGCIKVRLLSLIAGPFLSSLEPHFSQFRA